MVIMATKKIEPNPLIEYLTKKVKQERWIKQPKVRGEFVLKRETKAGNLVVEVLGRKSLQKIIVLKKNINLFEKAKGLSAGEKVFIVARRYLGKYYAVRISLSRKDEGQSQLLEFG